MFGHRYFGGRYFGPTYFGDGADAPPQEDIGFGSGSIWRDRLAEDDNIRDKRWKKRRAQLEKISRLIDGVAEEVPSDVPEAAIVRQAEQAVEKAAVKLAEDVPPQFFDYRGLAQMVQNAEIALRQAEEALTRYEARKRREAEEQDDEEVLLLLA